jgi:hypothetical protein
MEEIDPSLEMSFGDTQYFFLSAQDPNEESLVNETSQKVACALVNTVLPFAFPYGGGGQKTKHATTISLKTCIQRYL